MNSKQRNKNRLTAQRLAEAVKHARLMAHDEQLLRCRRRMTPNVQGEPHSAARKEHEDGTD